MRVIEFQERNGGSALTLANLGDWATHVLQAAGRSTAIGENMDRSVKDSSISLFVLALGKVLS
jgi:hypothetical protein